MGVKAAPVNFVSRQAKRRCEESHTTTAAKEISSCFRRYSEAMIAYLTQIIMDSSPPYPPYPPFPPYPPYPPVVICCCCHGGTSSVPQPSTSTPPTNVSTPPPATGGKTPGGGKQPGTKLPNPLDIILGPATGLVGGVASFAEDAADVVGGIAGGIGDFLDSII